MRRRALWTMPYGLYLVGSRAGDRRNLMTLNWATQVASSRSCSASASRSRRSPTSWSAEGGVFSLGTIDREDRAIVRKFTKPVEIELDADGEPGTANGFAFHAEATGAPILDQAPAWFDCEVRQAVDLGEHTFFIGEVVACGFQKDEDTPVLRMEDTRMNYGG